MDRIGNNQLCPVSQPIRDTWFITNEEVRTKDSQLKSTGQELKKEEVGKEVAIRYDRQGIAEAAIFCKMNSWPG